MQLPVRSAAGIAHMAAPGPRPGRPQAAGRRLQRPAAPSSRRLTFRNWLDVWGYWRAGIRRDPGGRAIGSPRGATCMQSPRLMARRSSRGVRTASPAALFALAAGCLGLAPALGRKRREDAPLAAFKRPHRNLNKQLKPWCRTYPVSLVCSSIIMMETTTKAGRCTIYNA